MNYKIIIPSTKNEIDAYYNLRFEVLRKPWGQPENSVRDEWENQSLHVLVIEDNGRAIATGRLQYNQDGEAQVRSMAVIEEFQGKGIGTEVLRFLEKTAIEKKIPKIILDARDLAVDFYKKNGYEVEGNSYTLFDVIQHFRMSKKMNVPE